MELPKPQTVKQLGERLCIPLEDILLPCRFCERFLPYIDLLQFDFKVLQLIWTPEDLFLLAVVAVHTPLHNLNLQTIMRVLSQAQR